VERKMALRMRAGDHHERQRKDCKEVHG